MKVAEIRATHKYYDPECDCEGCTAERDRFDATGRWTRDIAPDQEDERLVLPSTAELLAAARQGFLL